MQPRHKTPRKYISEYTEGKCLYVCGKIGKFIFKEINQHFGDYTWGENKMTDFDYQPLKMVSSYSH